ncbi:MAG: GGDEF domain-containing protein [Patescibacteria group bacterium]|mgnify:CR=1 FL=1
MFFPAIRPVLFSKFCNITINFVNLVVMANDELQKLKLDLHTKDLEIKELKKLVTKDALTGLFNRRGFEEEVSRLVKDVLYSKQNLYKRKRFYIDSISLLFLDLDDFKKVNDGFGHKVGDQILQQAAQIIKKKIRNIDFCGRWGGEELIVALIGSREENAFRKAEEIRKAIRSRVKINNNPVTVSIGVAELSTGSNFEELISRADKAMYEAKHRGKNNAVRYSELS